MAMDKFVDVHAALFCGVTGQNSFVHSLNGKPSDNAAAGRNMIITEALAIPEITHIFFLDADVWPPDDTIERLLDHDKDIVTGATRMFFDKTKAWSVSIKGDGNGSYKWMTSKELPKAGLFKAAAVGGSTILIKRRVFEAIERPWYEKKYFKDGSRTTSDVHFCNQAHAAGFDIFCDPSVRCDHNQRNYLSEFFDE